MTVEQTGRMAVPDAYEMEHAVSAESYLALKSLVSEGESEADMEKKHLPMMAWDRFMARLLLPLR